jgi:hypothetical protein
MKERPILFSGPMVRAILEGRKTVTRRVVKPQPPEMSFNLRLVSNDPRSWQEFVDDDYRYCARVPYAPGDRLWVRETFQPIWASDKPGDWETGEGYAVKYMATDARVEYLDDNLDRVTDAAKPSIHMPRWASRITLEVTGVRVERLQEITEEGALAEGVRGVKLGHLDPEGDAVAHRTAFVELWDGLNAAHGFGWYANPWVWVVEFRRL